MNIPNTRRAPTSATPTETDVGRSLWGGYDVPRAPRRRRDPPHGGGPQRAIRLADLFYRRPRRNDARASLWSSARRARRSDFNARIGYSGMPLSLWPSGPMRTRWFSHVKRGPDHDVV